MKRFILSMLCAAGLSAANASVNIQQVGGWFESGYVTWQAVSGATNYNVYVATSTSDDWTQLDNELVRQYPNYYRADAVGLKAGSYKFKVVPTSGTTEMTSEASESATFTAAAHDRSGFAHVGMDEGIGAYKNDGTLKEGARVIYVWADNAKTVSVDIVRADKTVTGTGLQNILYQYQKGNAITPLAIRIIGTIKKADTDSLYSTAEGLQIKTNNGYGSIPVTIEGIGEDAAIHGFGILVRNCHGAEFRNFAIMHCMDDALSLDTKNSNIWIHNMDLFYGTPGSDSDQAKGDGTVDIKGASKDCTVSYNHFYDNGKCSLGGMKDEINDAYHTYHHNWFDHSDSRHPRIRVQYFHIYNNYYDGNSKYGVGMTSGGSAFVESNYFRNCKYPMLTSKQGTDAEGDGTFSGEPGGVIKAYNNVLVNAKKIQYYDGQQTDGAWDAVLVQNRTDAVSATCLSGGTGYNATADAAALSAVPASKIDAPEEVPAIVKGNLGAGRMNHGDFKWTFSNAAQDENYAVISDLTTALANYQSTLVGFADGTTIKNGGATQTVDAGDGKGIDPAVNDAHVPSWGSGTSGGGTGGGDTPSQPSEQTAVLGSDAEYFWCTADNATAVNEKLSDGTITLTNGKFQETADVRKSDNSVVYSDKVGSLQLNKKATTDGVTTMGMMTLYCAEGISKVAYYLVRTGSMTGAIEGSNDGETFTQIQAYSGSTGIKELTVTISSNYKYVRITNEATGALHIQGLKVYAPVADERAASTLSAITTSTIELGLTDIYTLAAGTDYTTSGTGAITYTSSKSNVATVNATGKISAVAAGSTTITLTQAADETYKAGSIQFNVTVKDNLAASTLSVTSGTEVSLKMGETETSQITVANQAGALTYQSSATNVATVDANGLITAVAAGTATITISDAGSDSVKPGSATVTVTVEAAEQGGGEEEDPTPSTGGCIYEWATTGVTTYYSSPDYITTTTVKIHENKDAIDAVKILKSDGYMKFAPATGGFKKGDIITIAGCYNNKDTKSLKLKINTDGLKATAGIFTTQELVNGQLSADDPVEEEYVLTDNYDCLYVMRTGGTTTFMTKLKVVRPAADDPEETLAGDANNDGKVSLADIATIIAHLNQATPKDFSTNNADTDGSGTIDNKDVEALADILLEKNKE